MKRVTIELGGHAAAIVFDDADIDSGVKRARKISSATPVRFVSHRCFQLFELQLHLLQQSRLAFRASTGKLTVQLLDLELLIHD
jgi:hypothetical protein